MNKILASALTYLTARSPKLAKYAPLIPVAFGVLAFIKHQRTVAAQQQPAAAR